MSLARIYRSKFAARKGATLVCEVDREPIAKGEEYLWFKVGFRSRYKHVRCLKVAHYPKDSVRESSMVSEAYAAKEVALDDLEALRGVPGEIDDIKSIVDTAAEGIRDVGQQYRDAAEAVGEDGMGADSAERADTLDAAADDLDGWDADEDEPDFETCDNDRHLPLEERGDLDDDDPQIDRGDAECDQCESIRVMWWDESIDSAVSAIEEVELP